MGSGSLYLIGWVLMVSVLGGTVGGFYLDRWLGTTPWLTLVGIFLGMAAGFTSLFRTIQEQERIRRESEQDQGNEKNGTGK